MACKHLHVVNSIDTTTTENKVTLNFSTPVTSATNKERFCIKFPCCMKIPEAAKDYEVQVLIGGLATAVWDKYGNPLIASDIDTRKIIKGYFGDGGSADHILVNAPITYNCGCNNVL